MKWSLRQSILATLVYAEIFDYPLTKDEVVMWLIANSPVTKSDVNKILPYIPSLDSFYMTKKNTLFVKKRNKRMHASKKKWLQIKKITKYLWVIPSLELVGISGGLSMNNADSGDDIDLFCVVSPGCMWSTRVLLLFFLQFFGKRRRVGDFNQENKWCTNMFMTTSSMSLSKNDHNIYTAHEILQLVPIFERNDMYRKFLEKNVWVKRYLCNAWNIKYPKSPDIKSKSFYAIAGCTLLRLTEIFLKTLQLWYMKPHRTTEIVSKEILRFHPRDVGQYVKITFPKLLKQYKVPLDSRFL